MFIKATTKKEIVQQTHHGFAAGTLHKVPADLRKVIISDSVAQAAWEDITPLARNEWICWVESVKKAETRSDHIRRTRKELKEGKRRPCCWAGCPHR
ncbi:MAG: YdeI/OmpD-associated family protein [bacterium]|nr:YdeI/OmpD-associated family protein [bacterium]